MRICMLTTLPGSVDGFRVTTYAEGVEYDLGTTDGERALAKAFVDAGFAEEQGVVKATAATEPAVEVDLAPESSGDATTPVKPGRKPKAQ
jgi:hypothetical protein